jgi:ubiquitin carboxyl-terminal hydrolase 4/11/15
MQYFLGSHFKSEINMVNPLGTQGKLAFQFARFLDELWNKPNDTYSPSTLKSIIGEKNTMFQGYQQHDSQELLNSLLDSLHEDLNRVYKKPYVEL